MNSEEFNFSINQQSTQNNMKKFKESYKSTHITTEDLDEAATHIVRFCQKEKFSEEMTALNKPQNIKHNSPLYKLNPMLQEGVLRVGGRLSRAAMPEKSKQPMFCPTTFT